MIDSLEHKIANVNARLSTLLADSRSALRGEHDFGVDTVRILSTTIREMDPIMSAQRELRRTQPHIATELDRYVSQVTELKSVLEQIRVMLISRRATLDNNRAHMETVSRWATAFQSTR